MKLSLNALILLGLFLAGTAFGRIDRFPGLDAVIKEADVIAAVRVQQNLNYSDERLDELPYSASKCLVLISLKGGAMTNRSMVLMLRPPTLAVNLNAPVQVYSYYLVFLKRQADSSDGIVYRSIDHVGCVLPLAWGAGEKFKPTGNVKDDIKALIREYLRWRDEMNQVETKGLELILSR